MARDPEPVFGVVRNTVWGKAVSAVSPRAVKRKSVVKHGSRWRAWPAVLLALSLASPVAAAGHKKRSHRSKARASSAVISLVETDSPER